MILFEVVIGVAWLTLAAVLFRFPAVFYWLDRHTNRRGAEMWARMGYRKP